MLSVSGDNAAQSSQPHFQFPDPMQIDVSSQLTVPSLRRDVPTFHDQEQFHIIKQGDGLSIRPEIYCLIEKGFFRADGDWTCYRRNYFSVGCSYSLNPRVDFKQLSLLRGISGSGISKPIQSFAVTIAAAIEGEDGKPIELVQHTPKRAEGPMASPELVKLHPCLEAADSELLNAAMSRNPYALDPDPSHPLLSDPSCHFFERLQFKKATANNGKRRAAQQYFHIRAELWAEVCSADTARKTRLKIVQRCSVPVVVRGRSPGHYQEERRERSLSSSSITWPEAGPEKAKLTHEEIQLSSSESLSVQYSDSKAENKGVENLSQALDDNILDDSSVSSKASDVFSVRGASSKSSVASIEDEPSVAEQLASQICQNENSRSLLDRCFALCNHDRVERNIRRLLKILAADLRKEASEATQIRVARAIRSVTKQVATLVRSQLAHQHSFLEQRLPPAAAVVLSMIRIRQKKLERERSTGQRSVTKWLENTEYALKVRAKRLPQIKDGNQVIWVEDGSSSDIHSDTSETDTVEWQNASNASVMFFQESDAFAEFQEGLLELYVALENSLHNEKLQRKNASSSTSKGLSRVQLYWQYFYEKLQKALRPPVKTGTRRIEWRCQCGQQLYADFSNVNLEAVNNLEQDLLQQLTMPDRNIPSNVLNLLVQQQARGAYRNEANLPHGISLELQGTRTAQSTNHTTSTWSPSVQRESLVRRKYLAICTSASGIYKKVTELDVSQLTSDAALFLAIKDLYQESRRSKLHKWVFLKPVNVEFVHFTLWSTRQGYVSIYDRPKCVPPKEDEQYDFSPRPIIPLPPIPPEIFIHYLEHDEKDFVPNTNVWLKRLPKRVDTRVIDCGIPTYGWGIYIQEGPNRVYVFWIIMATVLISVLLAVTWAALHGDVQGGSGLGTLILALPSAIMAAFMFRMAEFR